MATDLYDSGSNPGSACPDVELFLGKTLTLGMLFQSAGDGARAPTQPVAAGGTSSGGAKPTPKKTSDEDDMAITMTKITDEDDNASKVRKTTDEDDSAITMTKTTDEDEHRPPEKVSSSNLSQLLYRFCVSFKIQNYS